jgi:2-polyprenyl-6-methoxyphenol hydroxylase-like FAD-dependent oxidoreductase
MMAHMFDTPVLIVGAGPVGAVIALELARNKVPCMVVERSPVPSTDPRTYYLNSRSMELLRRLGLATAIRRHGVSPDHSTDFLWTRSFRDPPVLVWHYPSVNQVRRRYATVNDGTAPVEPYQRVSGVVLEKLGRTRMRKSALVNLRAGSTIIDLQPATDGPHGINGVIAIVDDGADGTYAVRARYVAVCEAGCTDMGGLLDIEMDVRGPRQRYRSVWFQSSDPALRPVGTVFTAIAADGLTLVSHGDDSQWIGSMPIPDEAESVDPIAHIQASLGAPFAVDHIFGATESEESLSVAEVYNKGPVYLVGESAHQFYPNGGYSENTGIADAVDLGWKLAAAIEGWGGPQLLASYEKERRPVALFNRELSADLVEVGRRFSRLAFAGASREHLAGILEQDVHRLDDLGVQCGHRYAGSPVVWHENGDAPSWQWRRITASTWPGTRAPAVRRADGSQLFDSLGYGFTLVDLSGQALGAPLVKEAVRRGIPMAHLCVEDTAVRACWERDLVLVRPDQHVAWRDDGVPDDWAAILDRVTGNGDQPATSEERLAT